MKATFFRCLHVQLSILLVALLTLPASGNTIKWMRNGTGRADNNWNTTSLNWTNASGGNQAYADGDTAVFDSYFHYVAEKFTVIIDDAGVSPGAVLIDNPWCCNTMVFTNGDIKGACSLTVTNNWANPNLQVYFDAYTNSLTFSGGTFINKGTVHYRPSAPGTINFGSGRISITNGAFCLTPMTNGVTNANDFTVYSNGTLVVRGGSIDCSKIDVHPGGNVIFDSYGLGIGSAANDSPRDIYALNGVHIGGASALTTMGLAGRYPTAKYYGDVTVGANGVLRLLPNGQYGRAGQHGSGDLTLLGGSTVNMQFGWAAGGSHLTYCYSMQTNTQKLYLGDGSAATEETITFRGGGLSVGPGPGTGGFFFGTDIGNVIDDGATILRYESTAADGRLQFGWAALAAVKVMTCCSCPMASVYPFRGGSAGTIFAPYNTSNSMLSAVGASAGVVFTVTNNARVITAGKVAFYNWGNASSTAKCGHPGPVEVNGGTFSLEATGLVVEAGSIIVTNGGILNGIGAILNSVHVYDGSLRPGFPTGTLTISNLVLNSTSEMVFDLPDRSPSNEVIHVTGDLTLDGTWKVATPGLSGIPGTSYTILTCGGTITDNGLAKGNIQGSITVLNNEVLLFVPAKGTIIIIQ